MDFKTIREFAEKHPEQPKSNWPTYKEVKKSSKIFHKVLFKLFKGHVIKCKNYTDSGDLKGLPIFIAKE